MTRDFVAAATLLAVSVLIPTTVFFVTGTSSQAVGVAVASMLIVAIAVFGLGRGARDIEWVKTLVFTSAVAGCVLSHALIATLFEPVNFGRAISSIALAMILAVGASVMSRRLFMMDNEATSSAVTILVGLLLLIGIFGIAGLQPPGPGLYFKSVFPFTEPSHYALTLTPLLLAFSVNQRLEVRIAVLSATLAVAFLLESLSLVVGIILIAVITLPALWLAVAGAGVVALVSVLNVEYFTDRLDISLSSRNLSVLVYLQGWDLVNESMRRTNGWGLGFQQLGVGSVTSYTSSLIRLLAGGDANLRDGGFTLAKMLAEFGVLGGIVMAAYSIVAVRCAWVLRQIALRVRPATAGRILALALVSGYSVEVFVRGIGYFSGTTLMMLAALIFLRMGRARRSYE